MINNKKTKKFMQVKEINLKKIKSLAVHKRVRKNKINQTKKKSSILFKI